MGPKEPDLHWHLVPVLPYFLCAAGIWGSEPAGHVLNWGFSGDNLREKNHRLIFGIPCIVLGFKVSRKHQTILKIQGRG